MLARGSIELHFPYLFLNIAITILNLVDPLAANDAIWCRVTLVACYQLEESGLTIVFVLAKTVG